MMLISIINKYFFNNNMILLFLINMVLTTNYYAISQEIESNICNQNFYVKPICVDQLNSYKCKCNPGFIWNGDMCVSTALNSYFEFNEKSANGYVFYEKTFPKLSAFTLSTWLQIYNYSSRYHVGSPNDTRTIFTYSLENYVNVFRCQISSTFKSKHENQKKHYTTIFLSLNIYSNECHYRGQHTYTNNSFWLHLSITWNSTNGQVDIYLNGLLKSSCYNIGFNKEINTAGVFVLGQTHQENFFAKQNKKDIYTSTVRSPKLEPIRDNEFSLDPPYDPYSIDELSKSNYENADSFFEAKYSFIGRIFDFNIWNHVKNSSSIFNIFNDCRLAYCGNATQWSDFRQGTRGEVVMKWPTNLLWKRDCFHENYQQDTCNKFCNAEIGPVCRETIERNIRWPLTKANVTSKIKCFPYLNDSNKYAYRNCSKNVNEYSYENKNKQELATWQNADISECIQEHFFNLKNEVFIFYTTDNFDEGQILVYLTKLYDLTIQLIKSNLNNQRSIYDINTIIDTLFYLINAQHQIIKRNLDINFNLGYPNYEETVKFTEHVLAIIDIMLSLSKETSIWSNSLPIGSESVRLVEIVNQLSASIYDFQKLNFISSLEDEDDDSLEQYVRYITSKNFNKNNNSSSVNIPQYMIIDVKYQYIVFRQQLIFHEQQLPLNFKFPELKNLLAKDQNSPDYVSGDSSKSSSSSSAKYSTKKEKTKKPKSTRKTTNIKTTTIPLLHNIYDPDYYTTSITTPVQLDRYHFSPSSLQNQLPSIYFGYINFNESNLLLPLSRKTNVNPIDSYGLLTVYYSGIEALLPNHNKTFRAKDNNLNSIVVTVDLLDVNGRILLNKTNFNLTLTRPIEVYYNYLNNFNISDTRCVYLTELEENTIQSTKRFKWSRQECKLKTKNSISATCECFTFGTYSITNDLYDPNWSPPILENIPLSIPSYIGCIIVSLFCLATFFSLIYLKTKSATASVHKNLCISICLSQILIIISLTRFNYDRTVCQALGLLNHYMLFTVFAWLMNEAFNLYITITYAAHQSSPLTDTGSQWRFYLLGWLLPAVFVIALFVSKSNNYHDKKLCWFNLDNLWINVSPMICMLAVTMLVMIFSDKEHHESSYTKNEKANKLIANHTKAVWTQIVLLSLCWTFCLMSLILFGPIVKYLFAFLNCLQGSFLFIFYFLLNEEVRKYLRDRKKKRRLKLKEKHMHLANLHDLITKNMNNSGEDDDEDEDDDDDDDDDDDEEDEDETQKNPLNSQASKKDEDDKNYTTFSSNTIVNNNNNFNLSQSENSDNLSSSLNKVVSKKHSSISRSSITKSVKFESSTNRSPIPSSGNLSPTTPEKPSQLGLKSLAKPATIETTYLSDKHIINTTISSSLTSDTKFKQIDLDQIVWPQLKKKLSFRSPYNNNSNISSNIVSTTSTGADYYDTNEEKVTVL